jgi:HAE1 family hydrophobic/amphiphilic exporter-1
MERQNNQQEKSSDYRYLEKLEFRPELKKTWLNFFVTNFRVVILLIILLTVWGVSAFFQLPIESNPEVKIPYAVISTVYPGVSPSDVEELVTKKIETEIANVPGVKQITSSSANSFSVISVEFNAGENQEEAVRRLKDKVSAVNDLPPEAEDPFVQEVSFDDTPIFTFSLSGPYDGFTLHDSAEKIKDELEKIPGVREARISGGDEREFEIAYDPDKLTFYKISAAQANQVVAATNVVIPGGNFEGEKYNYPVKVDAKFFDAATLGNLLVSHTETGGDVYLKDIATVSEKAIKRTVYSRLSVSGAPSQASITVDIIKKTGESIIDTVDSSKKVIEQELSALPPGMTYEVTLDFSKIIREDFTRLEHDFLLTLILVFGILFLIVGLKEAIVAGLAIPLVFFATFGVMQMTGITLNFLSIFSLLLALGLLVDDAIVVVSATKQYLKTGKFTPEEAVLLVLNDFKIVLTTTTLATTWAFLPLLMASGIIGSYIRSIPITVSVTLVTSLLIALMINHPLAAVLERIRLSRKMFALILAAMVGSGVALGFMKNNLAYAGAFLLGLGVVALVWWYDKKGGEQKLKENELLVQREWKDDELIKKKLREQGSREDASFFSRLMHGIIHFDKVIPVYEKYLRVLISTKKRRLATLFFTLILFLASIALPITGIVPMEFFPVSDEDTIYISIEAPVGLNLIETDKITQQVEEKLMNYADIQNFSTVVGRAGSSPNRSIGGSGNGVSHLAGVVVTLVEKEQRSQKSYDLAQKMREDFANIKEAVITVASAQGGPPSGAAFEARIMGDDLQQLDQIANELKAVLVSIPGVVDANISLKDAPADYSFKLDPVRMQWYGLNAANVGSTIRMAISGTKISTIIKDNKELEVNARFAEDKIPTLEAVGNLQITNAKNEPVYLRDVAEIKLNPSVDSITRIDQKRAVVLSSGVTAGTRANQVLAEFQQKIKDSYELPEDYSIVYGGENEQNAESVKSIIQAMVLAAMLIISTLIIQFNSFKKAIIVLVTLPLALIGVFFGMAALGIALSFPGLIGILALFGIVVKNAIILIDKINLNLKSGIEFFEAVVDAGKSRLEAIFITSICTIFGIIPVTLSNATWMALGSVVIFGLMLSSFLTLFIIPALFVTFVKEEK